MPPEYPWEMSRGRLLEVLNETMADRDRLLREIEARAREALGPEVSDGD